jgi:hypothetical protein
MWTMRWRAPAPARGQREYALPTVRRLRPHDHSLPPPGSEKTKDRTPRANGADPARVGQIYFGDNAVKWVRFTSALTHSQLFLELESVIREASATLCVLSETWKRSQWTVKEFFFSTDVSAPIEL